MMTQISSAVRPCTIASVCEKRKAGNSVIVLINADRQVFRGPGRSDCTTYRAHINMWFLGYGLINKQG
jgi:hypothetical protein